MFDENLAPQLHSVLYREKHIKILARTIFAQCKAVVILTVCGFFLDEGCSDGFVLHILIGKSLEAGHDGKVVTVAVRRHTSSSSVTAGVGVALTPSL